MKKRIALLILCVLLLSLLVSCVSEKETDTADPAQESRSAEADTQKTETAETEDQTTEAIEAPAPETEPVKFEDFSGVKASQYPFVPSNSMLEPIITVQSGRTDYTFELHARNGSFFDNEAEIEYKNKVDIVIEDAGKAYWRYHLAGGGLWEEELTFVDVLIKDGNQYVGYAVVQVKASDRSNEDYIAYYAAVLECKVTTPEEAAEKGLTREQLQTVIDGIVEKNS